MIYEQMKDMYNRSHKRAIDTRLVRTRLSVLHREHWGFYVVQWLSVGLLTFGSWFRASLEKLGKMLQGW